MAGPAKMGADRGPQGLGRARLPDVACRPSLRIETDEAQSRGSEVVLDNVAYDKLPAKEGYPERCYGKPCFAEAGGWCLDQLEVRDPADATRSATSPLRSPTAHSTPRPPATSWPMSNIVCSVLALRTY